MVPGQNPHGTSYAAGVGTEGIPTRIARYEFPPSPPVGVSLCACAVLCALLPCVCVFVLPQSRLPAGRHATILLLPRCR